MKRLLLTLLIATTCLCAVAQDEQDDEEKKGFRKELLFTGGNLNLSFFYGTTFIGVAPQLGYSVTNWLDAGVVIGYSYISQRDDYNNKLRQHTFGPGAFVRLFPVDFLFATAQYEYNFITLKDVPASGGTTVYKRNVPSCLVGAGYTSGRGGRNSPYYYFSVSFDLLNKRNSPYTDQFNNLLPVFNAGFNIPLFQGRGRRG